MFTEIGREGTDCCPELSQSDSQPFKAIRWVLMSLKLMKDPDAGQEVIYLAEDTDLSQWHLEIMRDWQTRLDLADKQDRLEREDLIALLQALGHCPNEEYLEQMLEELGIDKKPTFTFGDTCFVWQKFIQNYDDELKLLQKAFQFFDKDNNGSLSVEEFRTANRELGNLLTDEEIMSFVEIVDVTQDGDIQYDELLASLMTQYTTVSNEVLSRQSSRMANQSANEDALTSPSAQPEMSRSRHNGEAPGIPGEISYETSQGEIQTVEVDGGTYQALILHPDAEPPDRRSIQRNTTEHLVLDSNSVANSNKDLTLSHSEITQDGGPKGYLPGQATSTRGSIDVLPPEEAL